jgi:DNA-binding NarL/FixJ family response regulator
MTKISAKKIRIIIADDHPLFRAGVISVLKENSELDIIEEASDGETVLSLIQELKPDIAILDIKMPRLSGLQVAKVLKDKALPTRVILLTMYRDRKMFLEALDHGVKGYVLKDALVQDIDKAIRTVANDQYYLSPELSGVLVDTSQTIENQDEEFSAISKLTPTERKIIRLIADLKSNAEIARTLFISKRTVENHRVNISRKLKLKGRNSLLKFAVKNKLRL